jgi:hypothetical protein
MGVGEHHQPRTPQLALGDARRRHLLHTHEQEKPMNATCQFAKLTGLIQAGGALCATVAKTKELKKRCYGFVCQERNRDVNLRKPASRLPDDGALCATVAKTKELKKRSWGTKKAKSHHHVIIISFGKSRLARAALPFSAHDATRHDYLLLSLRSFSPSSHPFTTT